MSPIVKNESADDQFCLSIQFLLSAFSIRVNIIICRRTKWTLENQQKEAKQTEKVFFLSSSFLFLNPTIDDIFNFAKNV